MDFDFALTRAAFWTGCLKITGIDVLLSGDNAIVIAMACASLAPRQRFWGMVGGAAGALLTRILFAAIIATLLSIPYLKVVGAAALIWIAIKLVVGGEEGDKDHKAPPSVWRAIWVIMVA